MNETAEMKRSLGLFDATMLVAGSMIGSGIFIVSADIARSVGSSGFLILVWLITGIVTIAAALSYGELAGMMPKAGGQYIYLSKAFNPLIGFLYGWTTFSVIQTGAIAAVAVAFAKFTAVFIPALSTDNILLRIGSLNISAAQVYAIASIVLITLINTRGVKNGKIVQTIFTSAKLIALFGLITLGIIAALNSNILSNNLNNMWDASFLSIKGGVITNIPLSGITLLSAIGVAMVGSLFSSDAWNNVTFIAGEIKEPKRNIPLSLFFGTLIVTVIYILANLVYISVLPLTGDPLALDDFGRGIQFAANDRVGTAAAAMILGDTAAYTMAILIMISTFGCNNGLILSGARVYYAMAKDKLFFQKAGTLNNKSVPSFSLILQCIWASLLCLSGTYGDLLDYTIFAALIFYILTILGIFILRKKHADVERPYKAFGYPVIPAIYIIVAFSICVALFIAKPENTGPCLIIVLLGIPFYYLLKKVNSKTADEVIH